MFKINNVKEKTNSYFDLISSDKSSYARIALNLGGSLQILSLKNNHLIKNLHPLNYNTTYASSILFPFTNRIKNGTYTFQENNYKLDLNLKEENNALHGLIYNKEFSVVETETTTDYAKIKLQYLETKKAKGFPYNYTVTVSYTLTMNNLNLEVEVKNDDKSAFPFNLGWHPYFWSSNLQNSSLSFDSEKKIAFDKNMIPVKIENINPPEELKIENKQFDDCYILNSNLIFFKTPSYKILISSSSKENYLQIFTPDKENTIAIEPITGPSNSFNNKLGLQILEPNETYKVNWAINLENNE